MILAFVAVVAGLMASVTLETQFWRVELLGDCASCRFELQPGRTGNSVCRTVMIDICDIRVVARRVGEHL